MDISLWCFFFKVILKAIFVGLRQEGCVSVAHEHVFSGAL